MKKILSTIAATAILATSSFAIDTEKVYMSASLGLEQTSGYDSGIAMILTSGLPVMEKGEAGPGELAVEAELTFDLSSPSVGGLDVSFFTFGGYAVWKYDITEQFFVKPRAGLVYQSVSVNTSYLGTTYNTSNSEISLSMGLQGGYAINDNLDVIFGYNFAVSGYSLSQLSAGVQYSF